MTKEEIIQRLKEWHAEEISDMEKYQKMACDAKTLGYHRCAGVLNDISDEEKSHADLLEMMLEKMR